MPDLPRALTLSSGRLTAVLLPDWGAKMVSLRCPCQADGVRSDKELSRCRPEAEPGGSAFQPFRSGRRTSHQELLSRAERVEGLHSGEHEFLAAAPFGPHVPDPRVYSPEDAYGFDEMFPGSVPGEFPPGPWGEGLAVGDHGDLWYRAWSWETTEGSATVSCALPVSTAVSAAVSTASPCTSARLWVEDGRLGWLFSKTLRFADPLTLVSDYRVENRGPYALPWSYYAHIICRWRAGMELELPPGRYHQLEAFGVNAAPLPETGDASSPFLTREDAFPDRSAAFYHSDLVGCERSDADKRSDAGKRSVCVLRDPRAGKALEVSWSAPAQYLAVWYNKGGWLDDKPLVHLGLEPATAGNPSLQEWSTSGAAQFLQPGGQVGWTLTLHVEDLT